jgi:hypothetical protein
MRRVRVGGSDRGGGGMIDPSTVDWDEVQNSCFRAYCRPFEAGDDEMFTNDPQRFAKWYESNRQVHNMVVRHQKGMGVEMRFGWPCPQYPDAVLPGGAMAIGLDPECVIEHEAISGLHGMVTNLTGVPHDRSNPVFSLFKNPSAPGWACYVSRTELAHQMANSVRPGHIWQHDVSVKFGPLFRFRSPPIPEARPHDIRIDTVTPLVIRSTLRHGNARTYTDLKASNLVSTLGAWTPRRILADGFGDNLCVVLLGKDTRIITQPIGGHHEPVLSVVGSLWLKVNAPTLWLLRVAERIGLGGRTAFGFGRTRIEEA